MNRETLYLDTSVPSAYYDSRSKERQLATKVERLAQIYIEKGLFPKKYMEDALHVAITFFYKITYLVSWNFEHMVKVKVRILVNSINVLEGFKGIEIVSPQEL